MYIGTMQVYECPYEGVGKGSLILILFETHNTEDWKTQLNST